ncbi:prenyltransferase/squalene oxidase repeat-containing protein [Novipirellula artificiosorum]|uniref:Prenyltransferase and squalene oxidase repeat protein n=1 Tax=Novipirellula artificiosorum TaxID=2528016 RepID=A0A5C6E139_9BACT|nr:prenyltransferase/squalene oxidase repeat-containing protein [Novipirellula artificiosorum]TWU42184.1 hypothetical protein Poly41_04800 [Novipirellula artificiosorum]
MRRQDSTAVRLLLFILALLPSVSCLGQTFEGNEVSRDVREMMDRGLSFLVRTQSDSGDWNDGGEPGAGTTALGLLSLLSSGEDPNFGKYHIAVGKAVRNILATQDSESGYMGSSMYHHGFALLALAEAYGSVDENQLWQGASQADRTGIGQALELGVRCAITSQKNNTRGGWRYSPGAKDADTSVSGAVLMGLLAARNAGIEVPDEAINRVIDYFIGMTSDDGAVAYAGGLDGFGESISRSAITCLVFSISRRKDLPQYQATEKYVRNHLSQRSGWMEYARYYQAQALFQADTAAWGEWNQGLIRTLQRQQNDDGSFRGDLGTANSTSLSLLALAVNYRLLPIYER